MTTWMKKHIQLIVSIVLIGSILTAFNAHEVHAQDISLHTTYTELSVPPGENIRYSVDVINNTSAIRNVRLDVTEAPEGWEWSLRSGGWDIQQISVKPNESWSINLEVDVPLQIERGSYRFVLSANGGEATLPLVINVTEEGSFQSELSSNQPNMEGHADSNFNFSLELRNRTAEEQLYALRAGVPDRGWDLRFVVDGQRVTSVQVEPNATQTVRLEVTPPPQVEAGTYKIPVQASNNNTTAETELEVVITGTYDMELTTQNEVLSYDIRAGKERNIDLVIRNTGTAEINDIELSSSPPANWEVTFEPNRISTLAPGESTTVQATIKSAEKSLPGDYVTTITASAPEVKAEQQFRMTVETSVLWGWIGVLIILAVLGGIYYLIRTYGRR